MHQEGSQTRTAQSTPILRRLPKGPPQTDYFRSCMKAQRESLRWSQRRLAKEIHERFGITLDPSAITRIEEWPARPKYAESVAFQATGCAPQARVRDERRRLEATAGLVQPSLAQFVAAWNFATDLHEVGGGRKRTRPRNREFMGCAWGNYSRKRATDGWS